MTVVIIIALTTCGSVFRNKPVLDTLHIKLSRDFNSVVIDSYGGGICLLLFFVCDYWTCNIIILT